MLPLAIGAADAKERWCVRMNRHCWRTHVDNLVTNDLLFIFVCDFLFFIISLLCFKCLSVKEKESLSWLYITLSFYVLDNENRGKRLCKVSAKSEVFYFFFWNLQASPKYLGHTHRQTFSDSSSTEVENFENSRLLLIIQYRKI